MKGNLNLELLREGCPSESANQNSEIKNRKSNRKSGQRVDKPRRNDLGWAGRNEEKSCVCLKDFFEKICGIVKPGVYRRFV
jgi:hypothetical protein